eukprot:GHVR01111274.1.p1 GENE.GHVR01111274.1~~GHVR01111274.1.p1  ORF type:complete len:151 (+),score=94.67 GHVR01111274.1:76-528(+)
MRLTCAPVTNISTSNTSDNETEADAANDETFGDINHSISDTFDGPLICVNDDNLTTTTLKQSGKTRALLPQVNTCVNTCVGHMDTCVAPDRTHNNTTTPHHNITSPAIHTHTHTHTHTYTQEQRSTTSGLATSSYVPTATHTHTHTHTHT